MLVRKEVGVKRRPGSLQEKWPCTKALPEGKSIDAEQEKLEESAFIRKSVVWCLYMRLYGRNEENTE